MRVLPNTPDNWPQGIYSAERHAEWYNKECIITLRIAGVVWSRAVGHQRQDPDSSSPSSSLYRHISAQVRGG